MPIQIPVTQVGFEASIAAAAKSAGRNLKIDLGSNARSINALSQPLGRITGQADEFTKSMEAANARVLAFGASVGVLNGVIQGFKSLVATTIEVEKSLADINTILQGSSQQLNKFKKDIFDVARETGNSFKTVSDAALELSRQGLPANEVVRRLKDSMILARLSGLDAAQAVEGLTAAVNSFSKEGLTTSQVLNKISNAAAKYAVSERDLIEGFKRSASVAQQAGVSIDELGGIITAVQQKTARGGAVIGNSFKTIFTRIQRPESLKLLEQVGVEVLDLKGNIVPATKLLEGLASKISSLSDIEVASITEKIGGGFQIAPLLAALDDYNSKTSVAQGATQAFLEGTNQAYERNAALNKTMASAINEASVNLKELANTLGEIGVTKGLSNVLSFFNSFISDVRKLLDGDSIGSKFAKSFVEGIGGVLSGPGLYVFGAIILKLTTDLVKFGTQSLKTFFNIGSAAKEINTLQGTIASTLLRNKDIQAQILALEGNRVAQAKFFTTALNEQYLTMQKMQGIAASIAPAVYGGTRGGRGGASRNAAGGYMPAVSQETRDISRGVGGARGGDRPVIIPNFAFGGGKKGTMVAHTGEYIVPNFAAGGSAIFNRDMVRSMGLPAGAKKIGAAGGFIPNFNALQQFKALWGNDIDVSSPTFKRDWSQYKKINNIDASLKPSIGTSQEIVQGFKNWRDSGGRSLARRQARESAVKISEKGQSQYALLYPGSEPKTGFVSTAGGQQVKIGSIVTQPSDFLYTELRKSFINTAKQYVKNIGIQPDIINDEKFLNVANQSFNEGVLQGAVGNIFEMALQASTGSPPTSSIANFDIAGKNKVSSFANSFAKGTKNSYIKNVLQGIEALDFKNAFHADNINTFDTKIKNHTASIASKLNQANLVKKVGASAAGYIPNFAKYIYDSDRIPADKGATLKAILASSAKKNLIIGPAGSGKSTLAGKLGKFLTGASDVANASEIDILSGAARAKGGGLSKNLEALIAAVNASGGKVSYLYAKNLDILSRRIGRTSASDGDLRSKKQLIGTRYAPLNQFDFMGAVKSRSRNFNMVSGAGGYIPNFADPLKEAIGREMSAGVPASQIYVDQNSSLKNSMNPMGLMVANRRDEPAGGIQGINRARREGANPMMYGAANGFVPNYAVKLGEVTRSDMGKTKISDQAIIDFNNSLKQISDQLRKGTMSFADANSKINQLATSSGSTKTQISRLQTAGQSLITAYNNELTARNEKAKELRGQRAQRASNKAENAAPTQSRDFLGTIFAVQAGLSFLTAATEGSSNQIVKFGNIAASGAQTFATAALAIQGLSSVGGKFGGVLSKLGPYGMAAAGAFAAFQVGKEVINELNGSNKRAANAANILAASAEKAAVRLDDLNSESKQSINRTVENLIKELGVSMSDPELPKLKEAMAQGLTGTSLENVKEILRANLEAKVIKPVTSEIKDVDPESSRYGSVVNTVKNQEAERNILTGDPTKAIKALTEQAVSGQGAILMRDYLSLVKEAKTPEELSSFLANPELNKNINANLKAIDPKSLFDLEELNKTYEQVAKLQQSTDFAGDFKKMEGKTDLVKNLKDQEASVAIIWEFVQKIHELRTETAKNDAIAAEREATSLSQALQSSLRKSVLERPTQILEQGISLRKSAEEIRYKQQALRISGDLSLSEDLRKRKLEQINHEYELTTIRLENIGKVSSKLNSSLIESFEGKDMFGFKDNFKQAAEEAKSFIQNFVSNAENQNVLERLMSGDEEAAQQIKQSIGQGTTLFKNNAQQNELTRLIKEYYGLSQNITLEEQQQINQKQKLFEISQKELSIEKQRQNLIERGNLYIKGAQNKLTSKIQDISIQSQLNDAQKEYELAVFEKKGRSVNPEENARAIEAINQKYFELQQKLNAEKAEAELRLEITRNLKIDDNITSLAKNTTAVGSVQDVLVNNVMPVLRTLPENLATQIKDAIVAANNGGQPVPQGGQTTSGTGSAIGMPYSANVNSDVKSLLDLVSKEISSDPKYLAAVYGNVMKESRGKPIIEGSDYSTTDNERIRKIFGSRVAHMSEDTLSILKKDPMFLGKMYGPKFDIGKNLGNTSEEEGMKYRGRGYVQITGKTAYKQAGEAIGEDLLSNPDLALDPEVAKKIAVWMLKQRKNQFTGKGGFDKMLLEGDQSKINKAVTSQFAGQSADSGYLGSLLTKVNNFADKFLKGSTNLSGSLDNTGKNFLQASGYLQKTSSTIQSANNVGGRFSKEFDATEKAKEGIILKGVDERLVSIMRQAAEQLPTDITLKVTSGMAGRRAGTRNHPEGRALDVQLYKNGKPLDNYGPKEGTVEYQEYERLAGIAKNIQQQQFPELNNKFRWGGLFRKNHPYDLMHFDTSGGARTSEMSSLALANKALSTVDPIRQAAQRVSGFEIGSTAWTDAAFAEAEKMIDKSKMTADEAEEKIRQMAETIQAAAASIISDAKDADAAAKLQQKNRETAAFLRQKGTFADGFTKGMGDINEEIAGFSEQIGERIPGLFADNMAKAMEDAILNGEDLGDTLRSAATSFLNEINRANFKNLANIFTSGAQQVGSSILKSFASGGPITGGSGTKDDVPALLMGGEFVMNKKAVSKYGMNLMHQLNNGNLPKFAEGGSVSSLEELGKNTIFSGKTGSNISGQYSENKIPRQYATDGSFYSPGMYGSGAIKGKQDLLRFATQTQTSGAKDVMMSGDGFSYVSLEPESARLTVQGRMNSPEFQAIQKDKEEAFNLYLQQTKQEQQIEEEYRARKKAFKKALVSALISTVATAGIKAVAGPALAGFQAGMGEAASQGLTGFQALGSGFKGIWSGGSIGGTQIGGLSNLFSGNMELANIGTASQLSSLYQKNPNSDLGKLLASNASNYISNISVPKAIPVNRATGGLISNTSGVDTVPAMLSGGEFIMNRAATQNIGADKLQSLNSGSTSINQDSTENTDKIVSKLDELITAIKENMTGNVSVNVTSDGSSSKETTAGSTGGSSDSQSNAAFAKKIKEAVIQVIQQEKRLGGSLRTT